MKRRTLVLLSLALGLSCMGTTPTEQGAGGAPQAGYTEVPDLGSPQEGKPGACSLPEEIVTLNGEVVEVPALCNPYVKDQGDPPDERLSPLEQVSMPQNQSK